MKLDSIIKLIQTKYPLDIEEEWDNSGLQVRSSYDDIKTIYVALDATNSVIDSAIKSGADLIITHHPFYFDDIKTIDAAEPVGLKTIKLINNKISLYSMHTNYDKISMSYVVAYELGFDNAIKLDEDGYGCIVNLPRKQSSSTFIKNVLKKLKLPSARIYGSNFQVRKIAIMPGSGKSFIDDAIANGCDLILTGDIDYHSGINASENNIIVADVGHYELEHMFIKHMASYLSKELKNVTIIKHKFELPSKLIVK